MSQASSSPANRTAPGRTSVAGMKFMTPMKSATNAEAGRR